MFTLFELCEYIDGCVDPQHAAVEITGLSSITSASKQDIVFISESKYLNRLNSTQAGAVIVSARDGVPEHLPCIIHPNPYLAYAVLSKLFVPDVLISGICDSAVIHERTTLADNIIIEANVSIAAGAVIGANTHIKSGTSIGENVRIADGCLIGHNVSICKDTEIGRHTTIHSGAVIGSDGFGFANDQGQWVKIHQLGKVIIGANVEVGANTCIDRGALDDTVIDDGVIIDNLVQIAHNVRVGKNTAMAAKVGIAGSTVVGENCTLGGAAKITGHITIADGTHVAADTLISASIKQAAAYAGSVPMDTVSNWRKNAVRFKQLDQLSKRVKKLENDQ